MVAIFRSSILQLMRPKRSLKAMADKARLLEEQAAKRAHSEKPGNAPYGLMWSEMDRRAMAFTTVDGCFDVWTDPSGLVCVYSLRSWKADDPDDHSAEWFRSSFVRIQDYYDVLAAFYSAPAAIADMLEATNLLNTIYEAREEGGLTFLGSIYPVACRLRAVLKRCVDKPNEFIQRSWKISDIPVNDHRNAGARKRARDDWARKEAEGVPLLASLNFIQ